MMAPPSWDNCPVRNTYLDMRRIVKGWSILNRDYGFSNVSWGWHGLRMDHAYIGEHNIVDRYEMGKLSEAECVEFEEHFADCPECQQEIAVAQKFRQGLKIVAARMAARSPLPKPSKSSDGIGLAVRGRWLVTAACLALACAAVLIWRRNLILVRDQLNQAKVQEESWRRRSAEQSKAITKLEQQLRNTQNEAEAGPIPSDAGNALPVLASVFTLNTNRGPIMSGSEPPDRIVISRVPQWIVLSTDQESDGEYRDYRVTLTDSARRMVLRQGRLKPGSTGTLSLSVLSSVLHQDDYQLAVEGRSAQGTYILIHQYHFRLTLQP
jgi:Putative zinc-finger